MTNTTMLPNRAHTTLLRPIRKSFVGCIPVAALLFILISIQPITKVLAADWAIVPSLTVTETYLDNVFQAPPGEEESDFITEIDPGISVRADGRWAHFNLEYRMQNLFYAQHGSENTINHQLATNGNAELLNNLLFVDVLGSYRQILTSPTGKAGFDNLSVTDNRADVGTYSISPYLLKRFGNSALAELRYAYERVDYAGGTTSSSGSDNADSLADTETQRFFANLSSDPFVRRATAGSSYGRAGSTSRSSANKTSEARGKAESTGQTGKTSYGRDEGSRPSGRTPSTPWQWSITYQRDEINTRNQSKTKLEKATVDLNYQLGPKLALLAGVGYENNDFDQSGGTPQSKGFLWNAGIAWNPTRRTSLEATFGRRPFGNTYSLALRHATRRTTAEVLYSEELTTTAQTILGTQTLPVVDESGNPVLDPTGKPQLVEVPLPTIDSGVFLSKKLTVNLSKTTAKSVFSLGAFREEREFQTTGEMDQVYGGKASWKWQLTARTSSLLFGQWQHQKIGEGGQKDNLWQIGLRATRKIRPDVDGYVEYRYSRQQSSDSENEYRQNSIAASLRIQF